MTTESRFTNFAVKLHTLTAQVAGAVYINGIQGLSVNDELQTGLDGGDGLVYFTFGSLVSGNPTIGFSTSQLKAFLDECGVEGMLVDSDVTHPGIDVYFQKMTQGGTRDAAAAGTHISTNAANGILVPQVLSLSHQEVARLTASVVTRKSGAVDPIATDTAANLPTGVFPSVDTNYTLGKLVLDSVEVKGLQSLEYNFGINLDVVGGSSEIYPTHVSISAISPSISFEAQDVNDIMAELTVEGKFYNATEVNFYAKKRTEGGSFVDNATAEHIAFSLGKCRVEWQTVGNDPKTISGQIIPWETNSGSPVLPVTIDTAAVIP